LEEIAYEEVDRHSGDVRVSSGDKKTEQIKNNPYQPDDGKFVQIKNKSLPHAHVLLRMLKNTT
jgi:hypothetical protein